MLNNVVIMGRLTATPELRQTPSSIPVTRFTVAVERGYAKQGEERKTDFINVIAWRSTAEFISKYFQKGSMIAIQGSIQTGSYEKDGVKHYTFDVVAGNVSFCGSKSESDNGNASSPKAESSATVSAEYTADDFAAMVDDEDLPF